MTCRPSPRLVDLRDRITTEVFRLCWTAYKTCYAPPVHHLTAALGNCVRVRGRLVTVPASTGKGQTTLTHQPTPDALLTVLARLRPVPHADILVRLAGAISAHQEVPPEVAAALCAARPADGSTFSDQLAARAEIVSLARLSSAKQFLPALRKVLREGYPSLRRDAAKAVGKAGPAVAHELLPALCELFRDRDPDVRKEAVEAAAKAGPAATPILLATLDTLFRDPDRDFRLLAVHVAEQVGPAAAPVLCELLRDHDWDVRRVAAMVAGKVLPAATPILLATLDTLLRDPDPGPRAFSADVIHTYLPAAARELLPALSELLRDPDPRVQYSAALAVQWVGPAAVSPPLLSTLEFLLSSPDRSASWEGLDRDEWGRWAFCPPSPYDEGLLPPGNLAAGLVLVTSLGPAAATLEILSALSDLAPRPRPTCAQERGHSEPMDRLARAAGSPVRRQRPDP